jgi:predicted small secreted protein
MKKTVLAISTVVLGLVLLQGCETLKGGVNGAEAGAKKDIVNTGHNVDRTVNAALEADKKFQEKYW